MIFFFLLSGEAVPKPAYPPPTTKQQRAITNGNALQLVELWKASFSGANLQMAGDALTLRFRLL